MGIFKSTLVEFPKWVAKPITKPYTWLGSKVGAGKLVEMAHGKKGKIAAFTLILAGAATVITAAVAGLMSWGSRNKIENMQEAEATDLKASIAANRMARVATSIQTGQNNPAADKENKEYFQQMSKGGLPGQQTAP